MIINFKIYEKLGFSSEVDRITEIVWKAIEAGNENVFFTIRKQWGRTPPGDKGKTIRLVIIRYNSPHEMSPISIRRAKGSLVYTLRINTGVMDRCDLKLSKSMLAHELKHIYEETMSNDTIETTKREIWLLHLNDVEYMMETSSKNLRRFFYMLYIMQLSEIRAMLQQDVKEISLDDTKTVEGNSQIYHNKGVLKDFEKTLSTLTQEEKMEVYTKSKFNGNIEEFYSKLKNEAKNKEKIYLKYLGKLYTHIKKEN